MEKSLSARRLTGTEELLNAMSNQDVGSAARKSRKIPWQQILIACFSVLVIAAAVKGFLYLDTEVSSAQTAIGSATDDLNALKTQVTSSDAKERLAAVSAEIKHLKATNAQLQSELFDIRESLETLRAKKQNSTAPQRKRKQDDARSQKRQQHVS